MVSGADHRKYIRLEHKAAILVKDEHSKYSLFAQMINYFISGLYLESNVALNQGTKIQIIFDNPPFQSGPKIQRSTVRWCRELTDYSSDYNYAIGVKFN
jgi:hypothetical protein